MDLIIYVLHVGIIFSHLLGFNNQYNQRKKEFYKLKLIIKEINKKNETVIVFYNDYV